MRTAAITVAELNALTTEILLKGVEADIKKLGLDAVVEDLIEQELAAIDLEYLAQF